MRAQTDIWRSSKNDEAEKLKQENQLLRNQLTTRWGHGAVAGLGPMETRVPVQIAGTSEEHGQPTCTALLLFTGSLQRCAILHAPMPSRGAVPLLLQAQRAAGVSAAAERRRRRQAAAGARNGGLEEQGASRQSLALHCSAVCRCPSSSRAWRIALKVAPGHERLPHVVA